MREIKFRAWDKKNKTMAYDNTYVCDITITFSGQIFCHDSYYEIYDYDFDLMQYTGVKDVNDKEIYEGDILKRVDDSKVVIKYSVNSHSFEWYSLQIPDRYWNSDSSQWELSEIVGNIYENPELVKR